MKMPLNASQTIAAVAVAAVLLAGAYAIGRKQGDTPAPLVAAAPVSVAQPEPTRVAEPVRSAEPVRVAEPVRSVAEPEPVPQQAPRLCNECLRVVSVKSEVHQQPSSGVGAIGGALVGGLLGNQIGGGNGRKIATVGGAVAGGYAGNEIEKNRRSERVWVVRTTNQNGGTHSRQLGHDPQLQAGDVVVWRDGRFERR